MLHVDIDNVHYNVVYYRPIASVSRCPSWRNQVHIALSHLPSAAHLATSTGLHNHSQRQSSAPIHLTTSRCSLANGQPDVRASSLVAVSHRPSSHAPPKDALPPAVCTIDWILRQRATDLSNFVPPLFRNLLATWYYHVQFFHRRVWAMHGGIIILKNAVPFSKIFAYNWPQISVK